MKDPAVAKKVRVEESEGYESSEKRGKTQRRPKLRFNGKDSSTDTETVTAPKGSMFNPLSKEDITGKFMDLAGGIMGEETAREIACIALKSNASDSVMEITEILIRKK